MPDNVALHELLRQLGVKFRVMNFVFLILQFGTGSINLLYELVQIYFCLLCVKGPMCHLLIKQITTITLKIIFAKSKTNPALCLFSSCPLFAQFHSPNMQHDGPMISLLPYLNQLWCCEKPPVISHYQRRTEFSIWARPWPGYVEGFSFKLITFGGK